MSRVTFCPGRRRYENNNDDATTENNITIDHRAVSLLSFSFSARPLFGVITFRAPTKEHRVYNHALKVCATPPATPTEKNKTRKNKRSSENNVVEYRRTRAARGARLHRRGCYFNGANATDRQTENKREGGWLLLLLLSWDGVVTFCRAPKRVYLPLSICISSAA